MFSARRSAQTRGTPARLLGFVRPYRSRVIGAIILAGLSALLSGATIGMLLPLFDDVLGGPSGEVHDRPPDLMPLLGEDLSAFVRNAGAALGSLDPSALASSVGGFVSSVRSTLGECDPGQALLFLVLVVAGLIASRNLAGYGQVVMMSRVEQGLIHDLRSLMYSRLLALDPVYFVRARSGELLTRFTSDVDRLRGAATEMLVNVARQSALLLVFLAIALLASWRMAMASLLVMPPVVIVLLWLGRGLRSRSHASQERMADFASILQETISGIRVVKAFSMEPFEDRRFHDSLDRHRSSELGLYRLRAMVPPLTEMMGAVAAGFLFWFGGRAVLAGSGMTAGRFLVFLGAVLSMIDPVKNLSKAHARVQDGMAAGERVFRILDSRASVREAPGALEVCEVRTGLVFDHVWFAYQGGDSVLRDVSFELLKGRMVALVGPSGAGKTTLADMIPRFIDPDRGRVLVDGVDLRSLRLDDIRGMTGIVTQEPLLFGDTVRANISCGKSGIPDSDLTEAARAANALEFIERLPEGFDTRVGERGATLSGGQKQRIAIARAILRDPDLLVFDEATSSLDAESEKLVQEAVEALIRDRTVLVIAHRLSTVVSADMIVVLDGGRVTASGPHARLLEESPLYRRLYEQQLCPPLGNDGSGPGLG